MTRYFREKNVFQTKHDSAIKIQSQVRTRLAKRQRARHAARVGSIRDSGRAAADDLLALSRPGTAAEIPAAGDRDTCGSSEPESEELTDGGKEARTLEMAAAIAVAGVQPPSSSLVFGGGESSSVSPKSTPSRRRCAGRVPG